MMAEISSADRFAGVLDGIVLDVILEGALLTSLLMVCAINRARYMVQRTKHQFFAV